MTAMAALFLIGLLIGPYVLARIILAVVYPPAGVWLADAVGALFSAAFWLLAAVTAALFTWCAVSIAWTAFA